MRSFHASSSDEVLSVGRKVRKIKSKCCALKKKIYSKAFQVAPKQCIFLYNTMKTTGIRQGMGIMHSDVMDTFFHSGDA